jgi:hypothetical protein
MKGTCLFFIGFAALISSGCGGGQEDKTEVVKTDTVVKTETIVVTPTIDSAAVAAHYDAAHARAKGTHQESHKLHQNSKKKILVDSHQPIEHHDVLTLEAPKSTEPAGAAENTQPSVLVLHDVETVYFRPDEKASFPGGEKAFDQYIIKNMAYPEDALKFGVTGTVYAVLYLDETGKISKVEFPRKEIGYGLETETRRLLLASPRWNPAKHNGTPVKSKFVLPVSFELNG